MRYKLFGDMHNYSINTINSTERPTMNTSTKKLPSLQPLRAIAFIGIFFLHAGALVNWSSLAVSTFFVLSGFLMVYTYIDRDIDLTLKGCFCFALSKIKKLYPLHILMLLLAAFRETFLVLYTRGGVRAAS